MLAEQPNIYAALARFARAINHHPSLHEDLVHEGICHFCRIEIQLPGRTVSFYLTGSRFHMLDWLRRGRSLDSPKRQSHRRYSHGEPAEPDTLLDQIPSDFDVFEEVSLRDIKTELHRRLEHSLRELLALLEQETELCEICRTLCISPRAVHKRKRRIIRVAASLGLVPSAHRGATRVLSN